MSDTDGSYDKDWNPLTDRTGEAIGPDDMARFPNEPLYDWKGKQYSGPVYDPQGRLIREERKASGYSRSLGGSGGGGGGELLFWIFLLLGGFIFYAAYRLVKLIIELTSKGFKALANGDVGRALAYWAFPTGVFLTILSIGFITILGIMAGAAEEKRQQDNVEAFRQEIQWMQRHLHEAVTIQQKNETVWEITNNTRYPMGVIADRCEFDQVNFAIGNVAPGQTIVGSRCVGNFNPYREGPCFEVSIITPYSTKITLGTSCRGEEILE